MSNQGFGGPQDPNGPQDPYGQHNPYGQQDPNQQPTQPPNQQPNQGPWQPLPPQQGGYQQGGFQQGGFQPAPPVGGNQTPYGQNAFKPVGDPGTLDLPWYGIGFGQAIKRAFQKYVRFDGRASRSEFWWFYLFSFIVSLVLSIPADIVQVHQTMSAASTGATPHLGAVYAAQTPVYIWGLVTLLPMLGLTWRRLHDTNRTGAWWFLNFACGIGGLVPLIMCIFDSNPEGQRYDRVQNQGGYGQAPGGYPPSGTGY